MLRSPSFWLAAAGLVATWSAALALLYAPTPVRVVSVGATYAAPTNNRERFAFDLLVKRGNTQPSADTVAFVVSWTIAEDSGNGALARNNPLNTTMCGFNQVGAINGDGACGVAGYATYEDGLDATAATLAQPNFAALDYALQTNDAAGALDALIASPWAASHYNGGADWPQAQPNIAPSGKHPPTDTMAVSANFYATGSSAWAGQAGGMHLGTDFAGNPGDNVYMPFDCQFDQTGFYDDSARWGHFLICYFADGTLFYSGHLQDVIQPAPGVWIPAGTVIGHIGQLYHTHIKIAPPGAPNPCEGSGSCEDFEAYYQEH